MRGAGRRREREDEREGEADHDAPFHEASWPAGQTAMAPFQGASLPAGATAMAPFHGASLASAVISTLGATPVRVKRTRSPMSRPS